jgi:hypothetical protein
VAQFNNIRPIVRELNTPFEQVTLVKRQGHLFAVCILHQELFWLTDGDGVESQLEQLFVHVTTEENPPLGVNHMDYVRLFTTSEYCEPSE